MIGYQVLTPNNEPAEVMIYENPLTDTQVSELQTFVNQQFGVPVVLALMSDQEIASWRAFGDAILAFKNRPTESG